MTYHHGQGMTRKQITNDEFGQDVETKLDIRDGLYDTDWDGL